MKENKTTQALEVCPHCGHRTEREKVHGRPGILCCTECREEINDRHENPDPDQYGTAWNDFLRRHERG